MSVSMYGDYKESTLTNADCGRTRVHNSPATARPYSQFSLFVSSKSFYLLYQVIFMNICRASSVFYFVLVSCALVKVELLVNESNAFSRHKNQLTAQYFIQV